jgi:threonine dehydrogenase-like Zn-dependent dehydrogenase
MAISLARILAKRPKGDPTGKEWIGLPSLPPATLVAHGGDGAWELSEQPLPEPVDGGICLRLGRTLVARCDMFWEPGMASVWHVSACQEDSEYVPGIAVYLDPHPPCRLCQPCVSGDHARCVEAPVRRWAPGWLPREAVVPPWTLRRGIVDLPPSASERACLFLDPLARVRNALVPPLKRKPRRVAVWGSDLAGVLVGLALERMLPDAVRTWFDPRGTGLESADLWGYQKAGTEATESDPFDLVVVAEGGAAHVEGAWRSLAPRGSILFLAPPDPSAGRLDLGGLWRTNGSVHAGSGVSPDDRAAVADWLPDLTERLERIPLLELPFAQAAQVHAVLRERPDILGVALVADDFSPEA